MSGRGPSRSVRQVFGKPGNYALLLSCGHKVRRRLYRPEMLGKVALAYCVVCAGAPRSKAKR